MNKIHVGAVCVVLFSVCTAAVILASPAVGVTPTVISRGTYRPFKVQSHNDFFKYKASSKQAIDMVVRTHEYAPGSTTGWHTHPGPVFITVTEGKVTFYEADDPTCTPKVVSAGEGYVDTGHGHVGRNESDQPAKDVTVIIAPVGLPFRGELPAPGRYCAF